MTLAAIKAVSLDEILVPRYSIQVFVRLRPHHDGIATIHRNAIAHTDSGEVLGQLDTARVVSGNDDDAVEPIIVAILVATVVATVVAIIVAIVVITELLRTERTAVRQFGR